MIDKSESVNWANVWWILGADHLNFEEIMGDFGKKNILQTDFEEKKACKEIPGKNNILPWKKISLVTYNAENKNKQLHRYMSGKNV